MSSDPALIAQFLSQNDVACPACDYSLRGCTHVCCPECGEEIQLSLRGESSKWVTLALRFLLWGTLARSTISALWTIGSSIYYSAIGPFNYLGTAWYVRSGISGVVEGIVGALCLISLRRLRARGGTNGLREISSLVRWTAILITGDLILNLILMLVF